VLGSARCAISAAETTCSNCGGPHNCHDPATWKRIQSIRRPLEWLRALVRLVGAAFPEAKVEICAIDEHCIDVQPALK
jgi:hypothetical protein